MIRKSYKKILSLLIAGSMAVSTVTFAQGSKVEKTLSLDQLIKQLKEISVDELPDDAIVTEEENKLNSYEVIDPTINTKTLGMVDVIVEFKGDPLVVARTNKNSLSTGEVKKEHEDFKKFLNSKNVELNSQKSPAELQYEEIEGETQENFRVGLEYYEVFNGMALSLRGDQVKALLESPNVKRVWKDEIVKIDMPNLDEEVYGDDFNVATSREIQKSADLSNKGESGIEPYMHDTIPYLGIDKIHDEGITGKGVKVGVLDTGIDYNHPDLKDVYVGGYDFVDMDNDPMETTYIDWQEQDKKYPGKYPEFIETSSYYTSHGTHVSGTIAGQAKNNVDYKVGGVAPGIELSVYRVLGPYGSGATSGIVAAIEQSVKDGMDVINLSLGAMSNDPMAPTSVAINNATRAGVVSAVAAGNAGQDAKGNTIMYSTGSPGVAPLAITVGAGTSDMTLDSININAGDSQVEARLLANEFGQKLSELKGKTYEIVSVGKGTPGDIGDTDLSGKIALIERGDLALYDKVVNAGKRGAELVIIYNNVPGTVDAYLGEVSGIPMALTITAESGKLLKAIADSKGSISFGDTGKFTLPGGTLAGFSSRGPVSGTMDLKPDVIATGVNIFSTYPEFINDKNPDEDRYDIAYARISGTSMATPHIAGIAALLLEKYPDYTPDQIKALMMNTANPLNADLSAYEEGAGMVDPYEAIHTDDMLRIKDVVKNSENGVISEIEHYTGSAKFKDDYIGESVDTSKEMILENKGSVKDVYKVSWEFNFTANGSKLLGVKDGNANNITFNLPETIEVGAGATKAFTFKPIIPETAQQGLYEGYIYLENESNPGQSIRIPFALKYVEKGIKFQLNAHAFANKARIAGMPKAVSGAFLLNNPMKYIEFVLLDENDNAVGYLKRHSGSYLSSGVIYRDTIVNVGVYKLTGNPMDPISDEMFIPKDGNYRVAMVGVDELGDTFIVKEDLLIANIDPEIEITSLKKGVSKLTDEDFTVREIEGKEYSAYWIEGRIYDPVINQLNEMGHKEITQAYNSVTLFIDGRPFIPVIVKEDGTFVIGIEKSDFDFRNAMEIGLLAATYSGMGGYYRPECILTYGDKEFGLITYEDRGLVGKDDNVKAVSQIKNAKDITELEVMLMYDDYVQTVSDIAVSKQLQEIADANNGQVNFDIDSDGSYAEMSISITKKDNPNEFVPLSGDIDILEFNQKTLSNEDSFFTLRYTAKHINGSKAYHNSYRVNIPKLKQEGGTFKWSIMNKVEGRGFEYDTLYNEPNKYVESIIKTKDGKEIKAGYDGMTQLFVFDGLTKKEEVQMISRASGHLTVVQTLTPHHVDENGNQIYEPYEEYAYLKAGDVNGDEVIDILDFKQVYDKLGTKGEGLAEDLTGDGYVNDVDLSFVVSNYLRKGDLATKEPQKVLNDQTIETMLTGMQDGGIFAAVNHEDYTFTPGEDFTFELELNHITYDLTYDQYGMFEVPIYVAYYDAEGRMVGLDSGTVVSMFARVNDEITVTTRANAKSFKVFLWDGLNNMNVVRKYTEFKAN